jgi:hypothetical protein
MRHHNTLILAGKRYSWDGRVFQDINKAKTSARRYLKWGYEVHMKTEGGNIYLYTYRPFCSGVLPVERKILS